MYKLYVTPLKIRDIVARWRGSTHDSRIFRESAIRERFEANQFCGRLIGDSGYPLMPYLFTPVLNPTSQNEEAYNTAHICTRNTIERCFGVWKQRFRCLLTGFTVSLPHVKLYIIALAILHNIAIDMGEGVENITHYEEINRELHVPPARHENQRGQTERRLFIDNYF
jgi:nuclease HARBI1